MNGPDGSGEHHEAVASILADLERAGTERARNVQIRHGVTDRALGTKVSDVDRIARQFRPDHDLAQALWATSVHDARLLALRLAEPDRSSLAELDRWLRDVDDHVLCDALVAFVAKTSHRDRKIEVWRGVRREWVSAAGWGLVAHAAGAPEGSSRDGFLLGLLDEIERTVADAPNRTRHAMTMALIAIGGRNEVLREAAIESAGRIGPVPVDHGDTSCVTPEPVGYIERIWAHRR